MVSILISNQIKVSIGIKQGCLYNFSPKSGVSNHYYIVLNRNPKDNQEIHLAPFTTKKESVLKLIELKKLDRKTFVEIKKGDCNSLPQRDEMGIDCNRLIHVDIETLIELIDKSNGSCNYPDLRQDILEKVIEGVKLSRLVKPSAKLDI